MVVARDLKTVGVGVVSWALILAVAKGYGKAAMMENLLADDLDLVSV